MSKKNQSLSTLPCQCGSGSTYGSCCERFHSGLSKAPSAELLMRARYTAFVLELKDYLLATWHPQFRPENLVLEPTKWIGLKIKETKSGLELDNEGWVQFVARYKVNGRAEKLEEYSYFNRVNGDWVYVEAQTK